ncbi:MAG: GNAT family protein [Candidatus Pacearchaeota archaeon]|jgi:RimJ/RimL family protein N-acetyltransferase
MKLTTKRLILRDIKNSDEKNLIKNINNLKVSKNLFVVPYPYTKKDAKWWINHCNGKKKNKESYNFVIELKSEKKLIGGIGLDKLDKFQGTTELGYWLGEKYWKQKIMTEAVKEILDFAFDKLKLRRVDVHAYTENKASNALIKKMGFTFEGRGRKAMRAKSTGKIHDANIYGLLKSEWKKARGELK